MRRCTVTMLFVARDLVRPLCVVIVDMGSDDGSAPRREGENNMRKV